MASGDPTPETELANYIASLADFAQGVPGPELVNHSWYAGQVGQVGAILDSIPRLNLAELNGEERPLFLEAKNLLEQARQRWGTESARDAAVRPHALPARHVATLYHLLRALAPRTALYRQFPTAPVDQRRSVSWRKRYALVPFDAGLIAKAFREVLQPFFAPTALDILLAWTTPDGIDNRRRVDLEGLASASFPEDAGQRAFSANFRDGNHGTDMNVGVHMDDENGITTLSADAPNEGDLKAIVEPFERTLALAPRVRAARPSPSVPDPPFLAAMDSLTPGAAAAFRQALLDLASARLSYRGPANELRQALWEVLQELAPDAEVMAEPHYKAEARKEQAATLSKPTHRQRAAFIMRKRRGKGRELPAEMLQQIETLAALARSAYDRSNRSTHSQQDRDEAEQVHRLVDLVLRDLLKES